MWLTGFQINGKLSRNTFIRILGNFYNVVDNFLVVSGVISSTPSNRTSEGTHIM